MKYIDRKQAGQQIADLLTQYVNRKDVLVLGLPRGGIPVAYEIATRLHAPLDALIVRKLGVPYQEELAMGAIASGDTIVLNKALIESLHISEDDIDLILQKERIELVTREQKYRNNRPFPTVQGKTIILVDDGIATGATMKAAIAALQAKHPKKVIVAVPVAAQDTCREISALVHKLICPLQPDDFFAVGLWYEVFSQTTDEEVITLLKR